MNPPEVSVERIYPSVALYNRTVRDFYVGHKKKKKASASLKYRKLIVGCTAYSKVTEKWEKCVFTYINTLKCATVPHCCFTMKDNPTVKDSISICYWRFGFWKILEPSKAQQIGRTALGFRVFGSVAVWGKTCPTIHCSIHASAISPNKHVARSLCFLTALRRSGISRNHVEIGQRKTEDGICPVLRAMRRWDLAAQSRLGQAGVSNVRGGMKAE